ncbi:MAG: hypothetical protein LBP85_00725 [Prevotellaceae bacterium]|jgi:tetratricopeptide (TPR) repeat protein|nr:hypothetical protein [Prevotellaceae bacterium]
MSYLVLHIDLEFIVGVVYTDNGNSYPITNGNDDLLWLYFFNDPHQNRISFGKENRIHFNNKELNYYGRFFELIENEQEKFTVRGIQKKAVELLEYSGLLKTCKEKYHLITHEKPDNIPALITFSLSISELAKQKTIEYFKSQGFQIDSYTIPLSELVCYYPFSKKDFIPANGNVVLLLAATNISLYLMKLVFSDNYFMINGEVKTCKGKGIDPRKRALVKFIVEEINNATGALSSEKEKESECEKMEPKAEEWLKRIDVQLQNRPFRIVECFSKMPNAKKEVFVRKDNIESDTVHYIQELMDIFDAFKSDNVRGDVAAVFLLGDCFQNSLVKDRFNKLIHNEKLFVYANKDIQNILSVYPRIDFKRYIDQEARIKALAQAEEQKKAEQRALEDRQRREQEAEAERIATEKKIREDRKNAQQLYSIAIELEKKEQLQDAIVNVQNALQLDANNSEYRRLYDKINSRIEELNSKTENYKSWLKDAEEFIQNDDLDKALKAYKNAQEIFGSDEIRHKIVETEEKIEKRKQEEKIINFISVAEIQLKQGKFEGAIDSIGKALEIDPANIKAKEILHNIHTQQHNSEIEAKYKDLVEQAVSLFAAREFDKATAKYGEALQIKPNDRHCLEQTAKIKDAVQQKENQEKSAKIIEEADRLFANENLTAAKAKYGEAGKLCPDNKSVQDKIKQCADKIKEQEDTYKELLFEATLAEKKGKLSDALMSLEKALKIKPDDAGVKSRIKKIKLDLESKDSQPKSPAKPKADDDDFLGINTKKNTGKKPGDDFLPNSGKIEKDKDDDFLNRKKNNKNIFNDW